MKICQCHDYPYNPIHLLCMAALLFFFRHSIVLAFVLGLRTVCITDKRGYTEMFPYFEIILKRKVIL